MAALQRHPVGVSLFGVAVLMALLLVLAVALPVSGRVQHFSGHAAMGVPLLVLLVLVTRTWPRPRPALVGRVARGTLLSGLAVSGVGLLVEGVGAFGYSETGSGRANALAGLHDLGVTLWPLGFVLLSVGSVATAGTKLAERYVGGRSRMLIAAAVLVVSAAVLLLAGGFVVGY